MTFPVIPTSAEGRALSSFNTGGGGTKTFPDLSSLAKNPGDLLLAVIVTYDGNSTNAEFSSWGGGFTEFVDQTTTTTMGIGVAYKWSDGTETGTFTVTTAETGSSHAVTFLLSIAGAHPSTPPEGGTIANGTGAAADPGSLNPSGWGTEDTLWIAIAGNGEDSLTGTFDGITAPPTNYLQMFESGVTGDVVGAVEGAIAFRQLNAASEDAGTFTLDITDARNSALMVAVRPAQTVAFDASTETTFTTTTPFTFSHTPVGTPQGVIAAIAHGTVSTDLITGTVSYGGVTMERVSSVSDSAGEAGRVYLYFLGSGIPTGTQTVSITHSGAAETKWVCVSTVTAAGDTEAGTGAWSNANGTNPLVLLARKAVGMIFGVIYDGLDAVASVVPLGTMTAIQDHDFGTFVARMDRETTASTGQFTFGYTAAADDTALAAFNVIDAATGVRPLGSGIVEANTGTTSFVIRPTGSLNGQNLYVHAISRDHTSGTALATCTDDSGGNTWALVSNDTDRKAYVWWKKGTAADNNLTVITVAGCVGSATGGLVVVAGGDTSADPTRDLTVETNASGDESHTAFTPTSADSLVMFMVADYANDTDPATLLNCTNPGTLEPELFDKLSTGGSDCRIIVGGRRQFGGPTSTGTFTWSQINSTTKSVAYTVIPGVPAVTGTGASTLDDATSAGSGTESMLATGATTLDGATSAGTGVIANPITGTGAPTLAGVTSAGAGVEGFPATGSSTLAGVTSTGTGVVANPVTGTGSSTLAGVTSAGTGTVIEPVFGTGSSTLDGVASAGSGNVIAPIFGTGSSTLQGVTSSGSGVLGIIASGSSSLDGVVSQGSGIVANPVTGTGASILDGVTSTGVGEVLVPGKIENVVCDLLGPVGECEELGPSGDCDSLGPLCVGSITT